MQGIEADRVISQVADEYRPPNLNIGDPEKYYYPKIIARFEKYGLQDSIANYYIDYFKDRPPFHFTLVGSARILYRYKDAPSVKKHTKDYLKQVFTRNDSYNPWTAEGTENHINMSRTSGYLLADLAQKKFPEEFPEAKQKATDMKDWIMKWSKSIYGRGTGEWHSSTYEFYNLVGWLNLYDYAEDQEVHDAARAVLDYYSSELALHYGFRRLGGPEMRGPGIGKTDFSSSAFLNWLWFSKEDYMTKEGLSGSQYIQMVHPITSSYYPPEAVMNLSRKNKKLITLPALYKNSKPSYLLEEASYIKHYMYLHDDFMLGTAFIPYGGWTGGSTQIINWRLTTRTASDQERGGEVGGSSAFYGFYNARGRTPFTQLVQHDNILIQMTAVPKNVEEITKEMKQLIDKWQDKWAADFKKRFPNDTFKSKSRVVTYAGDAHFNNLSYINMPEYVKTKQQGELVFVNMETVYLIVTPLTGKKMIGLDVKLKKEVNVLADTAELGQLCGYVLEAQSAQGFESFDDFCKQAIAKTKLNRSAIKDKKVTYTAFDGTVIDAQYVSEGGFTEPLVDWGFGTSERHIIISSPPYKQPVWKSGPNHGKLARWSVNGKLVDLSEPWPVYSGPNMKVIDNILTVSSTEGTYSVDFTGNVPTFKE